ncbi:MAG: hypothetical protein RTU92_09970 [Candidatus Thorarchaeota archaeon]
MEKMRIASKRRYRKHRVVSGHSPHNLLKMVQELALSKSKKESETQ